MATDLQTDSSDYRTELLSPTIGGGENGVILTRMSSWRLNFDEHPLPERHPTDPPLFRFGCTYVIHIFVSLIKLHAQLLHFFLLKSESRSFCLININI